MKSSNLDRAARRLRAGLVSAALFAGLAAAPLAHAQGVTPAQANQMVQNGQAEAAYAALAPMTAQGAGDPAFDSALGYAALESGRPAEAVMAYERVLAVQPDNYRARVQLGLAYATLGDLEAGRRELDSVQAAPMSAQEREGVAGFLTLLDTRLAGGARRTGGFIEGGAGYDSNVNGATQDTTLIIPALAGLGPATLTGAATAQDSAFVQAAANLYVENPLSRGRALFASATGRALEFTEEDDFSQYRVNLDAGLVISTPGLAQATLAAQFEQFWLGGDSYRQVYGAFGEWRAPVGERSDIRAQLSYSYLDYESALAGDANRATMGAIYTRSGATPSAPTLFFGVYAGAEEAEGSAFDYASHILAGLRAGGEVRFSGRVAGFAQLNYEYRDYTADYPLFLRDRIDNYYTGTVGAVVGVTDAISIRPSVSFTESVSNIGLFDYDRWSASINLRRTF